MTLYVLSLDVRDGLGSGSCSVVQYVNLCLQLSLFRLFTCVPLVWICWLPALELAESGVVNFVLCSMKY